MEKVKLEITWTSLWRIFIFSLIVTVFYLGREILLGLFLAIIISSGLESLVDVLERVRIPRSIGVILIFLILLLSVVVLVYTVLPLALVELNSIFSSFAGGSATSTLFSSFKSSKSLTSTLANYSSSIFSGNTAPLDFFSNALGGLGLALAVVISSFYLSLSHDGVERFIKVVVPPDYEEMTLRVYGRSKHKLGAWFRTQILLSLIMFVLVWIGMTLLGVKYAFFIGFIAGLFELIPFLGPILAGALGVASAIGTSTTLAIYVLIFFVIAQQFESNILVPLFSRRSVGIHPVIAIVALLIGAEIAGILGIIISVPAAAVFQEMIEEWSTKARRRADGEV
jgi:predicted PurR-regulated permease PerM